MNQREKSVIAFLSYGDGGTLRDVMLATASSKRQAEILLANLPCIYIDRWNDQGEPIYCMAETPPDCPKPESVARETRRDHHQMSGTFRA